MQEGGAVVYLNHDFWFERVFINSSIRQFATCLAASAQQIAWWSTGRRSAVRHC